MTIEHPSDVVLSAFAAGTLDEAQRVAIGKHLNDCKRCHVFIHALEQVGGIVLDGLPPAPLADGSLASSRAMFAAIRRSKIQPSTRSSSCSVASVRRTVIVYLAANT